jgi:rhodanese-related sulfurtransferase
MLSIKEINVEELNQMLSVEEQPLLIDVRSDAEVSQGAIPGSSHLPLHLLPMHINQLPQDKKIVFYCRSGARSAQACAFAANQGSDNVYNLRGGIMAWVRQGQAVA